MSKDKPKKGKNKKGKSGKAALKPPAPKYKFHAPMTRGERILLVLAWARASDAVQIGGVTYPCPDGWVDTWLLAHHTVGGSGAATRLRELRRAPNVHSEIERRERTVDGNTIVEVRFARG